VKALVLSGGGARGAYQVGVLRAVAEVTRRNNLKNPFKIYTGVSAGAINASFMAAGADDFSATVEKLATLWSGLTSEQVFKTDAISLGKIGMQWVGELSFGGLVGSTPGRALLDTAPLGELIKGNTDFRRIRENIKNKSLYAVAISALEYQTSTAITFVEAQADSPTWVRSRRRSENTALSHEHIVASSAIPLLFTPGQVGSRYFGDGCIRNHAPLSPALHLGADKLMVIGVRKLELASDSYGQLKSTPPSVARVMNAVLNSVLLDGIEVDMERLERINEFVKRVPKELHAKLNFKTIDHVWIHPSEDIGAIASSLSYKLPRLIRYLLRGLGPLEEAREIISYLLFEPDFCNQLMEVGYKDGMSSEDKISEFLNS